MRVIESKPRQQSTVTDPTDDIKKKPSYHTDSASGNLIKMTPHPHPLPLVLVQQLATASTVKQ